MNKLSTLAANGGTEHAVAVIGIDLAKNVFAQRFWRPVDGTVSPTHGD
jgi:hypothetical protein